MRYGLIGNPLGHSWSPRIHALLGDYDYQLYPLEPDQIAAFLQQQDLGGLNVTLPYKKTVIPYCARLTDAAKEIGGVNTLCFTDDGIVGDNTDCDGFLYLARRTGIDFQGRKVVVLGSGATSRTVCYCARKMGAGQIVVISRSGADNYENLDRHRDADILVNTTPLGMYPKNGAAAVSVEAFDALQGVLDVVYNPMRTALVQDALAHGVPAAGGLAMLVAQAVVASARFFRHAPQDDVTDGIFRQIAAQVENIVLIGMPGCGKTHIAQQLHQLTGRPLIDLDEEVARAAGKSVPQLITQYGEAHFRALEAEQARLAGQQSGAIIACGGGTPLFEENRRALSQNGRLYLLTRERSLLPTKGRPLSVDLEALERTRMPVYRVAADVTIANDTAPEIVAKRIWEAHQG